MRITFFLLVLTAAAGSTWPAQRVRVPPAKSAAAADPVDTTRRLAILAIENSYNPADADFRLLLDYARDAGGRRAQAHADASALEIRRMAVRAIGRLEDRELIPALFELVQDTDVRADAELALLLILRAHAPADGHDDEIDRAVNALVSLPASAVVLGQLPYSRAEQVEAAEARLRAPFAPRALEALARRNRRLGRLNDETIALLKRGATWSLPGMTKPHSWRTVFESMAALTAAGVMDEELIEAALGEAEPEIRRLGALALLGGGATLDASPRSQLIRQGLSDRAPMVRYEAVRAWARRESAANGCGLLIGALSDESMNVVLAAIDALGERCPDDESITARLVSELRTPPNTGPWQREAHALVAAARRAPDRAAMALPAFMRHLTWQVRMYAAQAAGLLNDVVSLEILAYDANDNVRNAALVPLRRLKAAESDPAFIAALGRNDYQLIRTAALTLKGAPRDKYLLEALVAALERVTAQKKETSRDTRLALIERIRELGGSDQTSMFERLLTDFDPKVASEAAVALRALSGKEAHPAPRLLNRPPPPTPQELLERTSARVRVELDNGRTFEMTFHRQEAPLAYARFIRLVRGHYYDGLTFHRVVPNFVIQGGSPGANEYAGDALFMRDELGTTTHHRGTIGISTRGHHTGDAQLFINLSDNRTLDLEYTVFAEVVAKYMDVVDAIQEGTRIARIYVVPGFR